jgi:hypothetical protein
MRRVWAIVVVAAVLYVVTGWATEGLTGLTRSIVTNGPSRSVIDVRRVETIGLDNLDLSAAGPDGVSRASRPTKGEVRVRLPDQRDYPVTLRMDPFPRPLSDEPARLPRVDVSLNGVPVATIDLRWTPERVGSYDVVLPQAAVRRGANRLVLRVVPRASAPSDSASDPRPGLTDGDALTLWYLRVHPAR